MQKHGIIGILLIIILAGCTRKDVDYFDNGNKKHELIYKGDKLDGEQKWYYENGNLQSVYHYRDGIPDGAAAEYNFNGNKKTEMYFKNGNLEGVKKTYYDNGNLFSLETYKNGKKDGIYKVWHPNGKLKIEGYFRNDQFDSTWRYLDKFGITVGEGHFKNGSGVLKSWYSNGNVRSISKYINSEKQGNDIIYDENGHLIEDNKDNNYKNFK